MDLINENSPAKPSTSHLLNAALELKLKQTSIQVVNYLKKTHKVGSASLEFIMDSKGLLYLVNLSASDNVLKKKANRTVKR